MNDVIRLLEPFGVLQALSGPETNGLIHKRADMSERDSNASTDKSGQEYTRPQWCCNTFENASKSQDSILYVCRLEYNGCFKL